MSSLHWGVSMADMKPSTTRCQCRTAVLACLLLLLTAGWVIAEGAPLYLRIRSAPVVSKPSFADGEGKGRACFGQPLEVLERSKDGDWLKVSFQTTVRHSDGKEEKERIEGWVHATALAAKPLPFEATKDSPWVRDGAAGLPRESASKLAELHAQRRAFALAPVQAMEQQYPSAEQLDEFMRAGKLGLHRPDWPALEGGTVK